MRIKEGMEDIYMDWKQNNQHDIYGTTVFQYAEELAEDLEVEIEKASLSLTNPLSPNEIICNLAEDLANKMNITGAMQWLAYGVIAQCWIYGEEFRQWHIRRYERDILVE